MRMHQVDEQASLGEKAVYGAVIKRTARDFDGDLGVEIDMRAR